MIKVNADGIDKINNEYIQKDLKRLIKNNEEKDSSNFASDDKLELSSEALDLKKMNETAAALPEIRTEKVEHIKMKIDSGTYQINNEEIAERLIEEAAGR